MDAKKIKERCKGRDLKDDAGKPLKTLSAEEFRRLGLLQEVNRQFFHPLGLAMAVTLDSITGEMTLGPILDYRDGSGGVVFEDLSDADSLMKFESVQDMQDKFRAARIRRFGAIVQPIGGKA